MVCGTGVTKTSLDEAKPTQCRAVCLVLDGRLAALDGKSGNLWWKHDTGAVIWAPPATFGANGERYLLVGSGGPGSMKVPELKKTIGPNVLTVFVSGKQEPRREIPRQIRRCWRGDDGRKRLRRNRV